MFNTLKEFILNNSNSYKYYKNKYDEIKLIKKINDQLFYQIMDILENNSQLLSKLDYNLNNNVVSNENFLEINKLINDSNVVSNENFLEINKLI